MKKDPNIITTCSSMMVEGTNFICCACVLLIDTIPDDINRVVLSSVRVLAYTVVVPCTPVYRWTSLKVCTQPV